jgi:ribose transport system substrate-binding protein
MADMKIQKKFLVMFKRQSIRQFLMAICSVLCVMAPGTVWPADKIVVGLSQPNLGWPYIAIVTHTLEAEAAKLPDVDLIVMDAQGDIAKQSNDMDNLIAKAVDVILVCSLDGNAIVPSIKAAHDAGIPVLAISNEPASHGHQFLAGFSGPDDYAQGVIAAELMHDALDGKGNVVVIEGSLGQSTTVLRNQGFDDGLKKLNSGIVVLARQTANWDPIRAKAVMEDYLTAYGEKINGVFSQDDNTAASAGEVVRAAGRGDVIKIVGTGGSKNGTQAIRDGLIYGTMDQSPSTDGRQALGFALDLAAGKPLPAKRNIIPMPKITAENAKDFPGEW